MDIFYLSPAEKLCESGEVKSRDERERKRLVRVIRYKVEPRLRVSIGLTCPLLPAQQIPSHHEGGENGPFSFASIYFLRCLSGIQASFCLSPLSQGHCNGR